MKFVWLVLLVVLVGGFIFWKDSTDLEVKGKQSNTETKGKKKKKAEQQPSPEINITQRWDLPAELKEVSGIAYLDKDRFACVQDEEGTIFIYNKTSKKVEKQIRFAAPGDFEDIALIGNTAWIVRADGRLFEADVTGNKQAREYETPLTVEQNIEGLSYDKKNNRLLLSVKDGEAKNGYKGIYAFDLSKKTLAAEPVIRINVNHDLLSSGSAKKAKEIRPSAIGIQPTTGDLYVTDGPQRRLIVMDAAGNVKNSLSLGKAFQQPEGIAFSPQGELFISNEGTKEPGNIMQVSVE
jgi:uncharacterized protein YjiK